jgi:hypothetical protein
MPGTPGQNLGLVSGYSEGEGEWGDEVNADLAQLDSLVQLSVKDRALNTPAVGPAEGDRYILGAAPTGAWSGHALEVAAYLSAAWAFYVPKEGWLAWVADEDLLYVFNGSAWAEFTGGSGTDDRKVKVSTDDATPAFLEDKLEAGANITLAVTGSGANEKVQITAATGEGGPANAYAWIGAMDFKGDNFATTRGNTEEYLTVLALVGNSNADNAAVFSVPAGATALSSVKVWYVNTSTSTAAWVLKNGLQKLADTVDALASPTWATKNVITPHATMDEVDVVSLNLPAVTPVAGEVWRLALQRPAVSDGDDANTDAMAVIGILLEFAL